ncbi:hypothetical protein BDV95DRAFT_282286 [Massariosphaeria phaeospora]|uniref:Rhodopsin domain-containing protein n=1 Tax=Massariosphaeria phaeospora TaxID=100035 RepID=A0A7C8MDT7_9PLEO|nr:hypothetical protein BDV95DRAFT_282286 [Massariosphaeria phaeospora]
MDGHQVYTKEYLEADRLPTLLTNCVVTSVLCFLCLVLRVTSSRIKNKKLWLDDYAAIIAWICTIPNFVVFGMWVRLGYGKHIGVALEMDLNTVENFLITTFIVKLTYVLSLSFSRLSMTAFLWTIFKTTTMRPYLIFMTALTSFVGVAALLVSLFSCIPVQGQWKYMLPENKCVEGTALYLILGIPNMVLDVALIILPIPYIAGLRISFSRKIMVALTFLVAGITLVIASVRFSTAFAKFDHRDVSWDFAPVMHWFILEINSGIISVCLPACAPIVRMFGAKLRGCQPGRQSSFNGVELLDDSQGKKRDGDKSTMDSVSIFKQDRFRDLIVREPHLNSA